MSKKNIGPATPEPEAQPSAQDAPTPPLVGGVIVGGEAIVGPERRPVGEWAIAKGHDAAAFDVQKRKEKRPFFRGDRHRGPDVRVIRQHMGWTLQLDRMGRPRTPDAMVTEAEYDAAVTATYELGIGQNQRSA